MSVAEVLNPRALIPCKKNSVRKQGGNRTEKIRRFNGELECTQYVGETEREKTQNSIQKLIIVLCKTLYIVCVHTSPYRLTKVLTSTSMLIYEPLHLLSNIFLRGISFRWPPGFGTGLRTGLRTWPNRSVPTDPVLSLFN